MDSNIRLEMCPFEGSGWFNWLDRFWLGPQGGIENLPHVPSGIMAVVWISRKRAIEFVDKHLRKRLGFAIDKYGWLTAERLLERFSDCGFRLVIDDGTDRQEFFELDRECSCGSRLTTLENTKGTLEFVLCCISCKSVRARRRLSMR